MVHAKRIARVLALTSAFWLWLAPFATPAAAAGQTSAPDQIRLTGVQAEQNTSSGTIGPVRFNATVSYQMKSVARGFVMLFLFEDNADTATGGTSGGTWVSSGTGQAHLTTTYQPRNGQHTVTLVAALFKDAKTMLAWSATQPFSLTQWPGRASFDRALADRKVGNYRQAVDDLTAAIQAGPQVGYYYCWRADTRVRLGQYDAAVVDYSRGIELLPNDRSCWLGRGVALLWAGQQERALTDFTSVIQHSPRPDNWALWALRGRGVAHADLGQFSAAIADYKAYLSYAPNAPDRSDVEGWIGNLQSALDQSNGGSTPG